MPSRFSSCCRPTGAMPPRLPGTLRTPPRLRRAVFVIPVTAAQKKILDSLAVQYTRQSPYDYAFLGMRCASATYDVLQAAGIVPEYKHELWYNVFTTRQFRYLIYREYLRNKDKGWQLYTCKGSVSRKWEKDVDNWSNY